MTGLHRSYRSAQNFWSAWVLLGMTAGLWVLSDPFSTRGAVGDALPLAGALAAHAFLTALLLGGVAVLMRPEAELTTGHLVVRRAFSTVLIPCSRINRWMQSGRHPVVYTDSEQRVTVRAVDVPPAARGRDVEAGGLLALLDVHVGRSEEDDSSQVVTRWHGPGTVFAGVAVLWTALLVYGIAAGQWPVSSG